MDFSSQVLYSEKKRNTTTRANLWASALTDVCLKSDYGERETDLEVHCWFLVQLLDLPKAESLKYPGMTGSQQRCPVIRKFQVLYFVHSVCYSPSSAIYNQESCLAYKPASSWFQDSAPSLNISPFFGDREHPSQSRTWTHTCQNKKKVQFHSTGCKQVPAVPVKAVQTQPLWQKCCIYSHSYTRKN